MNENTERVEGVEENVTLEQSFSRVIGNILEEENQKEKRRKLIRNVFFAVVIIAAIAVLVVLLLFPVLQISGTSMTDTLNNGDIVIASKAGSFEEGDIIAFYYNNNVLVKRVIGMPGDWVNMDEDGNVYVNGSLLDEPYVSQKDFGECDIVFPYQVPESRYFVLGDRRTTSIDSRTSSIGCVSTEFVVGKLAFRIWPLSQIKRL